MGRQLTSILLYIIVGLLATGGFFFLVALQQLYRGRTGSYWRLRRTAGQRGGRLFLLSVTLLALGSAITVFTGLGLVATGRTDLILPRDVDELQGVVIPTTLPADAVLTPTTLATESADARLIQTPAAVVSATPELASSPDDVANLRPSATPTPQPTATEEPTHTPTPTITPSPTRTPIPPSPTVDFAQLLNLSPLPDGQRAPRGATVQINAAAEAISAELTPLSEQTEFPAGVKRVYLFIEFERMANGLPWARALFRDGELQQVGSFLWSLGSEGTSFFFFGNEVGFSPGDYEVRLFLGDDEINRFEFHIG